jgi:hypothetical protein
MSVVALVPENLRQETEALGDNAMIFTQEPLPDAQSLATQRLRTLVVSLGAEGPS